MRWLRFYGTDTRDPPCAARKPVALGDPRPPTGAKLYRNVMIGGRKHRPEKRYPFPTVARRTLEDSGAAKVSTAITAPCGDSDLIEGEHILDFSVVQWRDAVENL